MVESTLLLAVVAVAVVDLRIVVVEMVAVSGFSFQCLPLSALTELPLSVQTGLAMRDQVGQGRAN
jgi:hypothetical protein